MHNNFYQLILASNSPRRKELLTYLGVKFKVVPSNIDENIETLPPAEFVQKLALKKASLVYEELSGAKDEKSIFVIGADTIVVCDSDILGKPSSEQEAREFMLLLSSKTHEVYTAVSLVYKGTTHTFYEKTLVEFSALNEGDIKTYLEFGEYSDKAGGYGIQGAANAFIKKLNGSYSNVVGLPLEKLKSALESCLGSEWRRFF